MMQVKKGSTKFKKGSKRSAAKKPNPFELKFVRVKHSVLGKTVKGATAGAPGLSRKRAFENRKNSLGIEWKQFGKVNKIVDRRLGAHDKTITEEDKAAKRFAAERLKSFSSKSGNDMEEEELTHKGAALTSIQKYDQTMSDDEEEDDEIGADVVSIAHFGGGKEPEVAEEQNTDRASKRKEMIAELISKTKQQRFDKKMARDEIEGATERLDEKWKQLMQTSAIGSLVVPPGTKAGPKTASDDYDTLFCELKMDHSKRGEATEREKTEGELAHEERQKLMKLEKERLARMEMTSQKQTSETIESAAKKTKKQENVFEAKYDAEGKLINAHKVKRAQIKIVRVDNESSDEDVSITDESLGEDEGEEEEDFEQMLEGAAEAVDDAAAADYEDEEKPSDLPYVFEMPRTYENLRSILDRKSASEIALVISRLVKCFHPSLHEGNKKKLARLLLYLIRYYDDLAKEGPKNVEKHGFLIKAIFELLKYNAEYGARCIRALLRQQRVAHSRSVHEIFGFRAVALVTLVERLFPVTDVFHPVCTPTLAFALHMIATVRICSVCDAARMLLLCTVLTQYVEESKRYLPEVIAFFRGVFLVAVENNEEERAPTATFPISLPHRRMLYVESDCSRSDNSLVIDVKEVFEEPPRFDDTDQNRLCVLRVATAIACKFVLTYSTYTQSFDAIFRPILKLLSRLPRKNYPPLLANEISDLESAITAECQKCTPLRVLQRPTKDKKMLEMLEPRFEANFNAERKSRVSNNERDLASERKLLSRKVRKEMRGAMKELRKDNQFIAREKRQAISEDDRMRKEKTKRLMAALQGQESEYKKNLYMKQKP